MQMVAKLQIAFIPYPVFFFLIGVFAALTHLHFFSCLTSFVRQHVLQGPSVCCPGWVENVCLLVAVVFCRTLSTRIN